MSMTPEELERVYDKPDPWGYQTNPADIERKRIIIGVVKELSDLEPEGFNHVIDVACGEGWITKDLPGKKVWGYEISDQAVERWDPKIFRLLPWMAAYPNMHNFAELVLMTGCLYENYDWPQMLAVAVSCSKKYIVTSNIADRERASAIECLLSNGFTEISMKEFPYDRGDEKFTQRLRIFRR